MTDKEIIKALECCIVHGDIDVCKKCPLLTDIECCDTVKKNALDLINRQKTEIKRYEKVEYFADETITTLQTETERLKKLLAEEEKKYMLCSKQYYAIGIENFADKLKEDWLYNGYESPDVDFVDYIDILVKEMTEVKE